MNTLSKTVKIMVTLISLGFAFSAPVCADDNTPSYETIKKWWEKHSTEKIKLSQKISRVRLSNNETAYLTKADFYLRGRNDVHQVLLIRPQLQEAREIGYPVTHDFEVRNFGWSDWSNSVMVIESSGSGQGTLIGEKSIIQLNGWKPEILHQVEYRNNLGACIGAVECYSKEIAWIFTDAGYKWRYDLLEVIIVNHGEDSSQMETSLQINTYAFRNGLFKKTNSKIKIENTAAPSKIPLSN